MVGRLRLSYAVGVTTALTCALTLTFATAILHESPQDLKIVQVTEDHNHNNHHHHHLLGTATEHRFESFMRSYGKEYSTRKEYVRRLEIFAKNLIRAAEHQAIDPTAVHGVTPFSDLSAAEFEAMYTGVRGGGGGSSHLNGVVVGGTAPEMEVKGLPDSFDWRERGAVTGVKMQGVCGSCWAFSTTGSIEGANFIATGKLLNLSEQQLVDCDHTAGGIEEEDSYPYTGKKGECKFKPEKVAVKVVNFTNVPTDEKQIAANLVHHGPLAIGLNAIFMQTYISGVSCPLVCGKRRINHGVLLVGEGAFPLVILLSFLALGSTRCYASSLIEWRNTRARKLMRRLASSGLYFFHKRTFLKFLVVITFTYGSYFETQIECSIKL